MFEDLKRIASNASTLQPFEIYALSIDSKAKELIIQLNTEGKPTSQLFTKHIDSLEQPLYSQLHQRGVYSPTTEVLSQGRKKAGTPYTLKDTGDFYKSWKVKVVSDGIEIDADPVKETTNLFAEYGIDILGLTEGNIGILNESIIDDFRSNTIKEILE
jgi:hypothetical protein